MDTASLELIGELSAPVGRFPMEITENYAKHTHQAPCSCFKSGLTIDLLLFKNNQCEYTT